MRFFDFHTHIFPNEVAENALNKIGGDSGVRPSFDGTYNGLNKIITQMDNFIGALNCPIATKPEQVESINSWAASISKMPLLSLGTIHPHSTNKKQILEKIKSYGLKGIKLHPEYQRFYPGDKEMLEIWQYCTELDLIVVTHAGADAGIFENICGTPERFSEIIKDYPNLKLVLAHFGGWFSWEDVDKFIIGKNVFLDLSFTLGFLDKNFLIDMIHRHGVEKVLYGTDAPWRDPVTYIDDFLSLGFSDNDNEKILLKNAAELLDLKF